MNGGIAKVGIAVTVLILVLVGQLTYLQVFHADNLANDPRNVRHAIRDFARPRGEIVTSDGQVVARSVKTKDELKFQRQYPLGDLFSQIAGYQSFVFGNTGIEHTYNNELAGRDPLLQIRNPLDVLAGKERTGNVVLTISAQLQRAARDALGNQRGSVIVMDPRNGALLAMYSNPSFDPQPFTGHNPKAVQNYEQLLRASPDKPELPRAYRELFPPGSTFKTVTTTVGLDTGVTSPDKTYPTLTNIRLPQSTSTLANFGHESCGGTLAHSFQISCNTTFAQVGIDIGQQFPPGMQRFGIFSSPPLDIAPGAAASSGPPPGSASARYALAGIGQGDVAVTPLQMALVACAVANGGVIMQPHAVDKITDTSDNTIKTIGSKPWRTAMPPQTVATLNQFMVSVVDGGTGTAAQIPGVTVAGKTGTAETATGAKPHAWFISFAPAENPQVAVAVLVENGGNFGSEATGGQVAAPIAKRMIQLVLGK